MSKNNGVRTAGTVFNYEEFFMDKKQLLFGLLFGLGLFFIASYSIDNRGFHS